MKNIILSLLAVLVFNSITYAQCPVENTFSYGGSGEAEFSHTYYEGESATIFAVGYFQDQIVLGDSTYTTPNAGETGKYIARLDTLGNLLSSWQVLPEGNIVGGGDNQRGYFAPGIFVNSTELYIPTTYIDSNGDFVFTVESYDLLNGTRLWRKDFQGGADEFGNLGFDAIAMDGFGNLILTGVFPGVLSFQGEGIETIGTLGQNTAFVMSLSTLDGTLDVFVPIESAGNVELFGLETDENNGVYVSGNSLGASSININGNITNYSGENSGFIFKMTFEYVTYSATLDWINILESNTGIEIPSLTYEFDANGSRLHYAAVDYPDDSVDSLAVDTKLGALFTFDGTVAWEHDLAVPGWYYLTYTSWLDPNQSSIYYPVWVKSGSQDQSKLYMDGSLLEDSISSLVVVQKFNSVDGFSETVSPTLYSFIGDVVALNSGKVFAQSNYTSAGDNVTLGELNPSSYPFFYGYLHNSGVTNTTINATLEASTSANAGSVTYQWYKDGETIPGAIDSIYIPIDSGFYAVEITNSVGCDFKTKSIRISEPSDAYYDSLALVDIYLTTNVNDTSWVNTDNWLSGPIQDWFGVGLNAEGRVVSLDLSNNNLYGNIPMSIADLTALNQLYLQNNNLSGEIPAEIGSLVGLQELVLRHNSLSGNLPPEIGNINQLVNLELNENQFVGPIPPEYGNLELLENFIAAGNLLSGELPQSLENLTKLIYIDISTNDFSGNLPDIIHLPTIERIYVYGNSQLVTNIPKDLDQLTQLRSYHIDGTVPIGGELPQVLFSATFMESYGISGMNFTGSLSEDDINGLSNLTEFYMSYNFLTGDLPQAFASLENLTVLNVDNNNFTNLPDFSGSPSLINLAVQRNHFQISELVPNAQAGFENFNYAPQRRIGGNKNENTSAGGSLDLSTDIEDFSGAAFQWIFNNDTLSGANEATYTINNFNSQKAGAYFLQASHPDLPGLTLFSGFINVKANLNASTFYVDNNSNHTADFKEIYQAVAATKENDTIYVAGSEVDYDETAIFSPRTIIGPGYFLAENSNTQFNKESARTPYFNITKDASGTKIFGIEVDVIYLNNQSSSQPDTLKNVRIQGNKIQTLALGDKNNGITISQNFIDRLQVNSTTALNGRRTYDNITITGNIIDSVSTLFAPITAADNGLNNFNFDHNTITFVSDSINDVAFNNNIIDNNLSGNSTGSGNINFSEANFTNASGNLSIDNDFVPQPASLDKGAFAGNEAYILSGIPPIPHIYDVVIGARLSATVKASNKNESNINQLRYVFRRNNINSSAYNARGFTTGQDIDVQFLPNRTGLVANQNYELVLVARDENGKRSHRTYVPYQAIAANLSGSVIDVDDREVNNAILRLFEVNPYANKYDTAAVKELSGSNNFNFENLILGDYIILADPNPESYPDLIPTYLGNTIDWSLATTLELENTTSDIVIEVEKTPEVNTNPGSTISGVLFEEYDEADSSLRKMPRRRVSGSSVTIRTRSGSLRGQSTTLRLINDGDIVAYTKTDENGEFMIPNLPEGEYRIQYDYPGVEVDETSDIFFTVSGNSAEEVSVEAVVEDGKITIRETGRVTGNKESVATTFKFYPNPAKSSIFMQLKNSNSAHQVRVLNLNGTIVKEFDLPEGITSMDVKELQAGVYFIQLKDEDGNYFISRLIKE